MDDLHFDRLRCRLVLAGFAAALGLGTARLPDAANAKRRKKKVKRNEFGCVDVGRFCNRAAQCCSGICTSGDSDNFCSPGSGTDVICTTNTGGGWCRTTTGNAGFCNSQGKCFPCTKDAECVPVCGAGAACYVCAGCPDGTACGSPDLCIAP
jgi:hypothetical protein